MAERSLRCLPAGIDAVADRTALHEDDRVVAVLPGDRRREAEDVPGPGLTNDSLEADGRKMVALIDDELAVLSHQIGYDALAYLALNQGDVEQSGRFPLSASDDPNLFRIETEKGSEAGRPLIHKRLPMDENQRTAPAGSDYVCGNDRLAEPGGCGKHARIMPQQCMGRFGLIGREFPPKGDVEVGAEMAFIADLDGDAERFEQNHDLIQATPRQADVPAEQLGAGHDASLAVNRPA
jgi:hypothetical protein